MSEPSEPADPVKAAGAGLSREQELARTFVMLADSLVEDYDIVDLLDRLAVACVRLLGVTAAGLLLDDQQGNLAVVASSSEETRLLEVFQVQNDEGPCLDCVRGGAPVVSADLEADRVRWPLFASFALEAGFRSVVALPLRLRQQTIGGLNLFHERAVSVTTGDQQLAQALADMATIGILKQRSAHRSAMLAEHLQRALNSRVVIEQAKGILAERNGLSMEAAFAALRLYARDQNIKLTELAVAVVHNDFNPLFPAGRPAS
jgi:GAF domain-containing protein